VNDTKRKPKNSGISRKAVGLPEGQFVFCCFNGTWKITEPVFGTWMRLLREVPHSVLWLLGDNEWSQEALKTRAKQNGIEVERLVFAPRTDVDFHLARHHLADVFLDTTPYGAHTAANDSMRMGLPIVTMLGGSFQGRVAASVLMAASLPELIVPDLREYEKLAFVLAKEPDRLAGIKEKCSKVAEGPLFDGHLFRRSIEAAFEKMWNVWQRGQKPTSFSVSEVSIR
jgi:predicted O-linked N-acetylglucosamine transferase (SPINDLY family)